MKFQEIDVPADIRGKYDALFARVAQLPPGKAIRIDAADLGGTVPCARRYIRILARKRGIPISTRIVEGGFIVWLPIRPEVVSGA